MSPQQLITAFRSQADDTAEPYLWTDDDLLRYINFAQNKFVRALGGIRDTQGPACSVDFEADQEFVEIDVWNILKIDQIRVTTAQQDNDRVDLIKSTHPYAKCRPEGGKVFAAVMDEDDTGIRLVRKPQVAGTLTMAIKRMPTQVTKNALAEEFELDVKYHEHLIFGVMSQAYAKQDAETRDDKLAEQHTTRFDREIAEATRDSKLRRSGAGMMEYGGL